MKKITKRGYLKKFLTLIFLYSFVLTDASWAQSMSDQEVLRMTIKEKSSGASDSDIVTRLIQNGATLEQIQRVRQQYEGQITRTGMDNTVTDASSRMRKNNGMTDYDTSNPAFPDAGSVVQESLDPSIYGASQENFSLTISPDGDITFPEFGPVHVSGLTVADAQSRIRSEVGGYYSSSQIKISLGQTRTIMVNVMGEVNVPGTYAVSAFATVFHALYCAGGINSIGTLRNIKVFRHGRQISQVDVYEFILNGRMAGNVRLEDDDVIQVGTYESVVEVSGGVKRPMAYEMKSSESLATLLTYCGGFADNAYKKLVCVLRNEDMKSVYNVDESEFSAFNVADGDQVIVSSIVDRYKNMVEVQGAVFRPGKYQLGDKVNSVRSLVETASGLTEEAMSSHAIMRRLKANRTQEVLPVNIEAIMNGTEPDIPLKNEDVLFIPTLAEHQNLRTFSSH